MSEWQPIDTAPKNGTQCVVARWYYGRWAWSKASYFNGEWQGFAAPTHWMPLPEPPDDLP